VLDHVQLTFFSSFLFALGVFLIIFAMKDRQSNKNNSTISGNTFFIGNDGIIIAALVDVHCHFPRGPITERAKAKFACDGQNLSEIADGRVGVLFHQCQVV
jgi:coenzyme F420-reducing hydrogenase delta subunit